MRRIILAAKIFVVFLCLSPGQAFSTGIPVFDGSNITQTTITAFENVHQTLTQLQQYATQLQQLEDQIKNSLAPAAYLWGEADRTINRIHALQSQVLDIYSSVGNLDDHLRKFGDLNYYRDSPYFNAQSGGTKEQRDKMMAGERAGLESQRAATETTMRVFEQQQAQARRDAEHLRQLSASAQTAEGRMAALQYANQFASLQNDQLIQLRETIRVMHQATIEKQLTDQDVEARRKAATEAFLERTFDKFHEPPIPKFSRK